MASQKRSLSAPVIPELEKKNPPEVKLRDLARLSVAIGFTLWRYRAGHDFLREVMAPGYFQAACNIFQVGDVIFAATLDGDAILVVIAPLLGKPQETRVSCMAMSTGHTQRSVAVE